MRSHIPRIFASAVAAGLLIPLAAFAGGEFAGQYEGDSLSVNIAQHADAYAGEIRKGEQHFTLKAHEDHGRLVGVFSTGGDDFKFAATLGDNRLTLTTEGTVYILQKHAAVENPLHAIQRDRPAIDPKADNAQNKPSADALADYSTVNSTDFGKALSAAKPRATTVVAALQSTFPDLAKYFGEKPKILGVFEDGKDHRTGGASFTASLSGHAVNGFVSVRVGDKGAMVAVVYCRADAPQAELNKLLAKPADAAAPVMNIADVKLHTYQFPDGTGTVGLAEGWTTNSPSLMTGVSIKGSAGQEVNLALSAEIITANSPLVLLHAQAVAQARQWGGPMPPPIKMLMAEYTDPETAMKALNPQFSRLSAEAGGPTLNIDKIISVQKVPSQLPGGQAAIIIYDVTKTLHGNAIHDRAGIRWDMMPVGQGTWSLFVSQIVAPADTYDRDLPAMLAMAYSLREDPQVVARIAHENIEAANARFAAQQKSYHELQDAFDAQHRAWERNSTIQSRSFADFDETIIGYRTVIDTSTGNRTSVDLGNVHDVVDHLNRYEPGRFKELPLRDEMYPLDRR